MQTAWAVAVAAEGRPQLADVVVLARRVVRLRAGRLRAVVRLASTRLDEPSIDPLPFSAWRALRRAAYHSRPAPAAVAMAMAGVRRTNMPATRAPPLSAPSWPPAPSHFPACGTACLRLSPTEFARSSARSEMELNVLIVEPIGRRGGNRLAGSGRRPGWD